MKRRAGASVVARLVLAAGALAGTTLATEIARAQSLFDLRRSTFGYQLDVGPIWARKVLDEAPHENATNFRHGAPLASEIAIGSTTTAFWKPFYLIGANKSLLRIVDDKSFSWAIFHQEFGGGLALGPLEAEGRFGVSLFSIDVFHASWSGQLLSPRAGAALAIHVGRFRVSLEGHGEYLWRWFGPDYAVRGIGVGLRYDVPRVDPKSGPRVLNGR